MTGNTAAGESIDHPFDQVLLALLSVELDCEACVERIKRIDDWQGFLALCRRHRVMSLVAKRLLEIPDLPTGIAEIFRDQLISGLSFSMLQVAEVRRLTGVLDLGGIKCAVLKGIPLSIRAFGDLASRDARDIDLLVAPGDLSSAVALLENAGLRLQKPKRLHWVATALYLRYSHELVFRTPTNLTVEVKARLHPTNCLMPGRVSDVLNRSVTEIVDGVELPTLSPDEELIYLCCHGARHLWFRHKWLVDIAFLAGQMSEKALVRAVDAALQNGLEVPVLEALAMAHEYLSVTVPPEILELAWAHPSVKKRQPMVLVAVQEQSVEVLRNPPIGHAVERSEYYLRKDWGYRWAVLERHLMVRLYGLLKTLRLSL